MQLPQQPHPAGVQNMQMNVQPAAPQGAPADQSQPQSGAEGENTENQPKPRGGKRELSTSKRAAQNRAAQVGAPGPCCPTLD